MAMSMQFPTKPPIASEDRTKFEERLTRHDPEVGVSAPVLKSRLLALKAVPAKQTSYFWLTYGSADGLIGAVIMEASTLMQARTNATVHGIVAAGAPFAEGHELSARLMASVPPTQVGRTMSGAEAAELLDRFAAVGGLADQRDIGFVGDQRRDPVPEERVVVDRQYANLDNALAHGVGRRMAMKTGL